MHDEDTPNKTDYSLSAADDRTDEEEPVIYKSQSLGRREFFKNLGAASGAAAATSLAGCGDDSNGVPDNTAQRYSTCTRETVFTHGYGITSVAYSLDGQYTATAGGPAIILWNATTGELLLRLNHGAVCNALAFSPDSTKLASYDGNIILIWDVSTGSQIVSISTPASSHPRIEFSSDGTVIVSNSSSGEMSFWNVNDGSPAGTYAAHHAAVTDMAMSADRSKVATIAGSDEMPHVWSYDSLSTLYSGTLGMAEPNATIGVRTWIHSSITISNTLKTVDNSFNINIATNQPGGRYVIADLTSPIGTKVRLWDGSSNTGNSFGGTFPIGIIPTESLDVLNGESMDGTWTLSIYSSVGFNSKFYRWSIRSVPFRPYGAVCFGRPGHILFGLTNGIIVIWDYENEHLVRQYSAHTTQYWIASLHVTPDGSKVVSTDQGGIMNIWKYDTGNTIVSGISNARLSDMSGDGSRIVAGHQNNAYNRNVSNGAIAIPLLDDNTTATTPGVDCSQSGTSTIYCSCDTVCSCDSVCSCDTVCTCDSQCTCQSQCTCDSDSYHYWYPN